MNNQSPFRANSTTVTYKDGIRTVYSPKGEVLSKSSEPDRWNKWAAGEASAVSAKMRARTESFLAPDVKKTYGENTVDRYQRWSEQRKAEDDARTKALERRVAISTSQGGTGRVCPHCHLCHRDDSACRAVNSICSKCKGTGHYAKACTGTYRTKNASGDLVDAREARDGCAIA